MLVLKNAQYYRSENNHSQASLLVRKQEKPCESSRGIPGLPSFWRRQPGSGMAEAKPQLMSSAGSELTPEQEGNFRASLDPTPQQPQEQARGYKASSFCSAPRKSCQIAPSTSLAPKAEQPHSYGAALTTLPGGQLQGVCTT